MSNWTDERVERLRALWASGLSCAQIGGRLGVSRNAVIGKVSRLGLNGRRHSMAVTSLPKRPRKNVPSKKPPENWFINRQPPAERYSAPPENIPPPETTIGLAELEDCHCRYPYGDPKKDDFTFCGRERLPLLAYCEGHARRCFTSVEAARSIAKSEKEMA